MKLKTIIVDDDRLSIKSITRLCSRVESIIIEKEFQKPYEALAYLEHNHVDLIFLDIEMPQMNGFELIGKLKTVPHVITTTSQEKYAYRAYENDTVDFLKKPIPLERFNKAIKKLLHKIELETSHVKHSPISVIYLKIKGQLIKINISDILYFEKIGDYLKVVMKRETHVIYKTLKSLDQEIKHKSLIKVHRSFIVNTDNMDDISENVIVIGKKQIPVSRAHKKLLKSSLGVL